MQKEPQTPPEVTYYLDSERRRIADGLLTTGASQRPTDATMVRLDAAAAAIIQGPTDEALSILRRRLRVALSIQVLETIRAAMPGVASYLEGVRGDPAEDAQLVRRSVTLGELIFQGIKVVEWYDRYHRPLNDNNAVCSVVATVLAQNTPRGKRGLRKLARGFTFVGQLRE